MMDHIMSIFADSFSPRIPGSQIGFVALCMYRQVGKDFYPVSARILSADICCFCKITTKNPLSEERWGENSDPFPVSFFFSLLYESEVLYKALFYKNAAGDFRLGKKCIVYRKT